MGNGQSQPGSANNQRRGLWNRISPRKEFIFQNIVRPNGMYPPEILELIMVYLDLEAMISSSLSCKLWLETSYQALKHLYRQEFDPSIDESQHIDYREMYIKLRKAKDNLRKGVYWPEILCSQYKTRHGGDVSYTLTTHNNDIAYSTFKVVYDSYLSAVYAKEAYKYNALTSEKTPHEFNCLYVGQTEMYFPVNEEPSATVVESHPIGQPKKKTKIEIASPPAKNMMHHRKNLDGSNQILIQYFDNSVEVFDTMSSKVILRQQLPKPSVLDAQRFYKNYIASTDTAEPGRLSILDLTTGEKKFSFVTSTKRVATYFFDGKFAYGFQDTIVLIDLEKGKEIRRIVIDTSELANGKEDIKGMLAITFDKWRLVVALLLVNDYHVLQVYDINNNFELLQTIHDVMNISRETKLELLPNGSIVVGDTNLTVYHFDHPALHEKITVGFYDDDKAHISMYNINAVDITKVALETLKRELDDINAVTVNKRLNPDTPFVMRMTCIFKAQLEYRRVGFLSAVEGWPKSPALWVPFAITNNELKTLQRTHFQPYRPPGFNGSCLTVFEEFDTKTGKWKFCKPQFEENLEIIRPAVKKISVDYEEIDYYCQK